MKNLLLAIALLILFLAWGIVALVWPEEIRDRIVRNYRRIGIRPTLWHLLFTETYIWSFRVGGAISILVAIFLGWLIVANKIIP